MVCCVDETSNEVTSLCTAPACSREDSDMCYNELVELLPYPATIFQDGNRSYFFPPQFECATQSTSQAVEGLFSRTPVTACGECASIAERQSSRSGICFEPEETFSGKPFAWWPYLDVQTQDLANPVKDYSALFELQGTVLVDAVEIVFGAAAGETLDIVSITACFAKENVFASTWIAYYEDVERWRLFSASSGTVFFDEIADECVRIVDETVRFGAETAVYERRRTRITPDTFAYVVLQVSTRGNANPIIDKFDVLPPGEDIAYCSASTGFAVCFCPPGYFGSGTSEGGCNNTAWAVSLSVNLSWATRADIDLRFGSPDSTWVADEIHLWQILLGKGTADPYGSDVPHYWLASTKVSVLEVQPGNFIATLHPLFHNSTAAEDARSRLMDYLASNEDTIMRGKALVNSIEVLAWNGDERECPRPPWGLRPSQACESSSFSLCSDTNQSCTCEGGGIAEYVWCADVPECTLSHETCHINEICYLTCDVNECAEDEHDCDLNAVCKNTLESFECECAPGWQGLGTIGNCSDVDECAGGTHDCHVSALCENTDGAFNCYCAEGFLPAHGADRVECLPLDECASADRNDCHPNATCTDIVGSFECACNAGYSSKGEFVGVACEDVDECSEQAHECDPNADCINAIGSYLCTCRTGWSALGQICLDVNECEGDANPCDSSATCNNTQGSFECTCDHGYAGTGLECQDIDECETAVHDCDESAVCNNTIGLYACVCGIGWEPQDDIELDHRLVCIDVNECSLANPCSNNATCANTNGSYSCTCNPGFRGDGIECLDESLCLSLNCHENADCRQLEGEWTCQCLHPFTGNGSWCQEDECQSANHNCHFAADCNDSQGSFACSCGIGWNGDGVECQDVDECSNPGGPSICAAEAFCANSQGSFSCACAAGYDDVSEGLGLECADIDECDRSWDDCDSELASCHNTDGSFTCTCAQGFKDDSGLGVACRDMDECKEGRGSVGDCGSDASCVNTVGSFECACFAGFQHNNESTCENIDECAEAERNNCDVHALCTDLLGTFLCTCNIGYQGTGSSCVDINECSEPNAALLCEEHAQCANTEGSFACECLNGFLQEEADGITACHDLDECFVGLDNCDIAAECTNSNGSFACACLPGWEGNGTACTDSNECSSALENDVELCPGEPSCINTVGSFVCDCPAGKRLDANLSCIDIDECLVEDNNCHDPGGICNNTEGSFECRCREGWSGDGVICEDIDECALNLANCLDPPKASCYNNDGSFTCDCELGFAGENCSQIACDPGEYHAEATKDCSSCLSGTFSEDGTKCTICPAGTYSGPRASSCQDCPPGRFALPGSWSCNFVHVESSCEECSFIALESVGDRLLRRIGSCGSCEDLKISNQGISWIQSAFSGMTQLKSLDLSWNELRKLRGKMFHDLHSLARIDLRGNRLSGLDRLDGGERQGTFYHLPKLEEIALQGQRRLAANDPTVLETLVTMIQTGSLRNVKKLDLSVEPNDRRDRRAALAVASRASLPQHANPKRREDHDDQNETVGLVELNLAGNDIGSLLSGELVFPSLQVLNIADCGIVQLEDGAFGGMPNLVELHLQNNVGRRNKILRPGTFDGIAELQVLDLRNNRIAGIQSGTFSGLSGLKRLLLASNLLCTPRPGSMNRDLCHFVGEELDTEAFHGLYELRELDLSDNALLGILRYAALQGLPRLSHLAIRQNSVHTGLVHIEAGALDALWNLTMLDLSGNSLGDIDEHLFLSLGNLTNLNMRYNRLEQITAHVFAPLSQLQSLQLDHNSLLHVDEGAFDGLQQLKKLDLAFNYLMDSPTTLSALLGVESTFVAAAPLPDTSFRMLGRLEELDLSHNELKSVQYQWFEGITNLKILSLAFNRIAYLPAGVFRDLQGLLELDLQGNHYSPGALLPTEQQVTQVYFRHLPRPGTSSLQAWYQDYRKYTEHFQWRTAQRFLIHWGSLVLSRESFQGLSSLQTLKLSHNGIRALPPGVFDPLSVLQVLHLDWNLIEGFRDSDLAILGSLTELRLRQRGAPCSENAEECWSALACVPGETEIRSVIKDIDWPMADCPQNEMSLLLCPGCEFFLSAGVLSRRGDCELCLNIDLSARGIVAIGAETFGDGSGARQLHLQCNLLHDVQGAPFSRLSELRTLDLSDNQLTVIGRDMFSGLRQLRWLDLSNNALTHLEDGAMAPLRTLEQLFLRGHRLQQIDMHGIGLPPSLQSLDLSDFAVVRVFSDILSLPTANFRTKSFALQPSEPEITWEPDATQIERLKLRGMGLTQLAQLPSLSSLRELDLSGNLLAVLYEDGALSHFRELRRLLLNNNRLKTITRGAFNGLASVIELSLHSNLLEELPEGALDGLDNVFKLDLSENRFQRLIWESTWAVNAQHVDVSDQFQLRYNDEHELEFVRDDMQCIPLFPRLVHCRTASCLTAAQSDDVLEHDIENGDPSNVASNFLDFVAPAEDEPSLGLCGFVSMADTQGSCGCTFETTEQGALLRHGNCSVLCQAFDMSNSGIRTIDASAFEGMQALRMLVLADNEISHLEASAFADTVRLQMLDLSRNTIQHVDPDAFRSLRVLSHLLLAGNSLREMSSAVLAPLTALQYLALQQNNITLREPVSLPSELKALKLSENNISFGALAGSIFMTSTNLEELDLDGNALGSLRSGAFAGAEKLISLKLSHSSVTYIEADVFQGLSSVVRLQMNGNTIHHLADNAFRGLSGLRVLELQGSGIESVSVRALRGVPDLQVLNLRDNAIQLLSKDVFMALRDPLLAVDLSHNRISVVEANTFNVTQRFRILNLTHNQINLLAPGTLPYVDEAYVFQGNRISCVPVFHANTLVIDWRYSQVSPRATFCLPSACPQPLAAQLALTKLEPWSLTERSVIHSVERLISQTIRADVATLLDDLHLNAGMYIDSGLGQRTWCSAGFARFTPKLSPCNSPGFYGNPCRPCPENSYCPGFNRSLPCPHGLSSPAGSTHVSACFQCPAGTFLFLDNLGCQLCPAGAWCTDQTLRACPEGALCPGGDAMPVCPANTWLDLEGGTCVSLGRIGCQQLSGGDDSEALTRFGGCSGDGDCTCSEAESSTCHVDPAQRRPRCCSFKPLTALWMQMLAFCTGFSFAVAVPDAAGIVPAGVTHPHDSDGLYSCSCPRELLGHGYGTGGCESKGWVVRILYKHTACLSQNEEDALLGLLGGLTCYLGAIDACDHVHYTHHGSDLGVNVLFRHTAQGKAAAESAAATFNNMSSLRRRNGDYPAAVNPRVGARVYAWNAAGTSPVQVLPAGMQVSAVHFEVDCAQSGCWVLNVIYTTGSSDMLPQAYNSFYLPYAVGSDTLSFDYDYSDNAILETFEPANFPCRTSDYVAASGEVESLPVRATGCCFGTEFDAHNDELGGDGSGAGVLGRYRVTTAFKSYAARAFLELCPGGSSNPQIITSGSTPTLKPEEVFPNATEAQSFVSEGARFMGMPLSPGFRRVEAMDTFIGQFEATIALDEREVRTKAGILRGTVGVEHTVDFFLGYVNFRPAAHTWVLDSLATQSAIHVEKTDFFTASTHGVNDYTFLEYVNLRLVAVLERTDNVLQQVANQTGSTAHYVQVTFTLGAKYDINTNSGLIPLNSVRAGKGSFFPEADSNGDLHPKCVQYTLTSANDFDGSSTHFERFNRTLQQTCAPAALMCDSPASIRDSFVSFNIPLGMDFVTEGEGSTTLPSNVFVDMIISAVDTEARAGQTNPGEGEAPWQMKTTLSATIPVVNGGVNTFCDDLGARTDLTDVANVDVVVGTAASLQELSRLRILEDVASDKLDTPGQAVIDSDSIEAGLLTLVLKGNASYFASGSVSTRGISLELEDVVTVHLMEDDGATSDGVGTQGKQQHVKYLLAEVPGNSGGLEDNSYSLNGAFFFTIDRAAQRAHLEPSEQLLSTCPLNPARPVETGNVVLETCVTRRDVRFRDFPWRSGAMSTAMEVSHSAGETPLDATTSTESHFFTTMFGNDDYAKRLAVGFAEALDAKYELNGRYRRAFWVNPGYEWTPTQTGGGSLFHLSQKVFLFALVTVDERLSSMPGKSIFDSPQFSGADPGLPKVPNARRRMLLTVDPRSGESSTLSAAELRFPVTRISVTASAFGVPLTYVATFAVLVQLTADQACHPSPSQVQIELQRTLASHVEQSASAVETVQVVSLTRSTDTSCGSRRSNTNEHGMGAVEMLVVFSPSSTPRFDLQAFAALPGIEQVTPVTFSQDVVDLIGLTPTTLWGSDETQRPNTSSSTSNTMLIIAVAAGVVVLMLIASACFVVRRRSKRAELPVFVREDTNDFTKRFADSFHGELGPENVQPAHEASRASSAEARLAANFSFVGLGSSGDRDVVL